MFDVDSYSYNGPVFYDGEKYEKLDPEELTRVLNEYLIEMTEIVFKYGGTLDKYIGDAVMAFWGAPLPNEDHAIQACRAALACQQAIHTLNHARRKSAGTPFVTRMGLHTGEPLTWAEGYVGIDVHRAARIAHVGHGGQVLLSETTTALILDDLPEGVSLLDLGRHLLKDLPTASHAMLSSPPRLAGMPPTIETAL